MELLLETDIVCPHCGETYPLQIDTSQGTHRLVEDCTVCCRPIALLVRCRPGVILEIDEER